VQKDFVGKSFLFVVAAAYSQLLCGLLGKYLLVSELHNAHIVRQAFLVHGQVTIIFVVSVCLSVCLFVCLSVCLFVQFFSAVFDPISIKLGHMLYVWV